MIWQKRNKSSRAIGRQWYGLKSGFPLVGRTAVCPANMIAKNKAEIEVVVKRPRETK
jgi:hypothetical protein